MTPCERFKDNIFDLAYEELDRSLIKEVQQHVESCPDCAQLYRRLCTLRQRLKQMKPVQAPDSFQVVLRERIRREKAHKKGFGHSPSHSRVWVPAVAVVSLVLIAGLFIVKPFSRQFDTVVEAAHYSMDETDFSHIQYVIDDLETQTTYYPVPFRVSSSSQIDSLLREESVVRIQNMVQTVRF